MWLYSVAHFLPLTGGDLAVVRRAGLNHPLPLPFQWSFSFSPSYIFRHEREEGEALYIEDDLCPLLLWISRSTAASQHSTAASSLESGGIWHAAHTVWSNDNTHDKMLFAAEWIVCFDTIVASTYITGCLLSHNSLLMFPFHYRSNIE